MTGEENLTDPEYTSIGENMAVTISFTTDVENVNFAELVGHWYSQFVHYNVTDNTCSDLCDQFLQVYNQEHPYSSMANHNNDCNFTVGVV